MQDQLSKLQRLVEELVLGLVQVELLVLFV